MRTASFRNLLPTMLLAGSTFAMLGGGCALITAVDRELIPGPEGTGGMGATGGTGGASTGLTGGGGTGGGAGLTGGGGTGGTTTTGTGTGGAGGGMGGMGGAGGGMGGMGGAMGGMGGSAMGGMGGSAMGGMGGSAMGGMGGSAMGGAGGGTGGAGGGGSQFAPDDMPGLQLWLDAEIGVTTNGSGVDYWPDQSGNGNHATQGTNNDRPALVTNGFATTFDAVEFDGAGEHLVIADADGLDPETGSFLYVAVGRFLSGQGTLGVWAGKTSDGDADNWRAVRTASNTLALHWGSDAQAYTAGGTTVSDATDYVLGWGVDSSSAEVIYIVNDVERVSQTVQGTGTNALNMIVGQDTAGAHGSNILVAEQVFYERAGAFSDTELNDLVGYFRTKYGF